MASKSDESNHAEDKLLLRRALQERWGFFFLKAVVILAVVALLSMSIKYMPSICMGIVWAVMSAVAALGIAYPFVMKKTAVQVEFNGSGILSRFNNGRVLRLLISFICAAILMMGILFESQRWSIAQWATILSSAPLYMLITLIVERLLGEQIAPLFQTKRVILISGIATALFLIVIYGVVVWLGNDVASTTLVDAYMHTPQPFLDSDSSLLAEAGKLTALSNSAFDYLIGQAATVYYPAAVVLRVVLFATAFFGISSLLGLCSLNKKEIRRVFQPLETIGGCREERPVLKRYVAWAVVLPVLLVSGFTFSEYQTRALMQTDEYPIIEIIVRDFVGVTVTEIDGQYYDTLALGELRSEAKLRSEALAVEAREKLEPLVNASFDARYENIDKYLSWYFDLPSKPFNIANEITVTPEEYVNRQFRTYIEEGIDDSELINELRGYAEQANALEREIEDRISSCRVEGLYDWLVVEAIHVDPDYLSGDLISSQKIAIRYSALMEGIPEESAHDAIAIKISEDAAGKDFSDNLIKGIRAAKEESESNIFIDIWDVIVHIPDSLSTRDNYKGEIESCIRLQRELLSDAIGLEFEG